MKKIILILFTIGIYVTVQSQTKPHFISVNIGASVPMGDYGSTDGNDESSGFATTGANFAIEGAGFINPTVGFGGYLGGNAHNIDEPAFISELNSSIGISGSTLTADPYGVSNYMAGIYLSVPATDIVFFRFKVLGGMFMARSPEMTITMTNDFNETFVLNMTESTGSKFAALFGASALFKVSSRIGIAANFEYTGAEVEFEYNTGMDIVTFKQKFTILNITAGLNIMLGPQE